MKMTPERFEREFEQLQASWGFEGLELSEDEREQLLLVCTGKIQKADFDRWLLDSLQRNSVKRG